MQVELAERFAEERYLDYASLASLQAVFRIRMDLEHQLTVLGRFFIDSNPDFLPIRIRTQEKNPIRIETPEIETLPAGHPGQL